MNLTPDMSLEEFIKLVERFANEQYGEEPSDTEWSPYEPESFSAEAEERIERMRRKKEQLENSGWDCTDADMKAIKLKVHNVGNIKVGRFSVRIKNYQQDKDSTTANVDIYEEKILKNQFGGNNKMPCKVNVVKDVRFSERPWLSYFKNQVSGTRIPIETVAQIVRWCQAVDKMGAFL